MDVSVFKKLLSNTHFMALSESDKFILLDKCKKIESGVNIIFSNIDKITKEFEFEKECLERDLKTVRNECFHLAKTFHTGTGDGDSYESCDICGKQL